MADAGYVVVQGLPSPQTYHDLRKMTGLTPPTPEMMDTVPQALQNSFACFLAYERRLMADDQTPGASQEPVGMTRLSGDGGLFLTVSDVAVHPEHRRKGIAKMLLRAAVDHIDTHAPYAYVTLVADPMGQQLYPQFGFSGLGHSIGMARLPAHLQRDAAWLERRGHAGQT